MRNGFVPTCTILAGANPRIIRGSFALLAHQGGEDRVGLVDRP